MQTLELINVGQAPNDGTGEDHRSAFQKTNANFGKVAEGIDEAGKAARRAADAAQEAGQVAGRAIPAREKGEVGGVAPLDGQGKVPVTNLPDFIPMNQKGEVGGVAPLDGQGKVPVTNLPDFIPMHQKGEVGGVAPLDAEGKVPAQNLPENGSFIPLAQKGATGGVATLGADGKVPPDQLPNAVEAIPLAEKGVAGGVASLDGDGRVPIDQLPPQGAAVGTPNWWPLRSSIPAGQLPQDGQLVMRATYPDLAAMVIAGTLPVVAEATWQSDPTQRGKYTLGDGATTIRLPDLNGKSPGTLGAVFVRGDGALSAGANGHLQADALQNITGSYTSMYATSIRGAVKGAFLGSSSGDQSSLSSWQGSGTNQPGDNVSFSAANSPGARTATETRPLNVTGVWTVHAFGAVVNPGSVDVAQLASDYAVLNSAIQTLNGQVAQAVGVGQTLQDVSAIRVPGTGVYMNSTGRPILVIVSGQTTAANGAISIIVNGSIAAYCMYPPGAGGLPTCNTLVPAGASYQVGTAAINIATVIWREYR